MNESMEAHTVYVLLQITDILLTFGKKTSPTSDDEVGSTYCFIDFVFEHWPLKESTKKQKNISLRI